MPSRLCRERAGLREHGRADAALGSWLTDGQRAGPAPSPRGSEPIPAASRNRDAVTPFRSRIDYSARLAKRTSVPSCIRGATGSVRFEGEAGRGPPLPIPPGGARGYHEPAMKRVLLLTPPYGPGPKPGAPRLP